MHKKLLLAHKICATCKKDFVWRKKWKSTWHQVLYCSERCRRQKKSPKLICFKSNDLLKGK